MQERFPTFTDFLNFKKGITREMEERKERERIHRENEAFRKEQERLEKLQQTGGAIA